MKTKRLSARVLGFLSLVSLLLLVAACGGAGGGQQGEEQANITRPIDLIVPFGPGGGSDQTARIIAPPIEEALGVQLPVTNTEGATGNVGITNMLSRPPDNTMAILAQDTLVTVALGESSFQLDDIQGICQVIDVPNGVYVAGDSQYKSWEDLAQAAQENPNTVKVATVGRNGTDSILLAYLEEQGYEFREVPFADPGERYTALLGGQVDVLFEQPGDVLSQMESGEFVPLLMFADQETVEGLEEVTPGEDNWELASEVGLQGAPKVNQLRGFIASADMDPAVVQALEGACQKGYNSSEYQKFRERNFDTEGSYQGSEGFSQTLNNRVEQLSNLQEKYGLK